MRAVEGTRPAADGTHAGVPAGSNAKARFPVASEAWRAAAGAAAVAPSAEPARVAVERETLAALPPRSAAELQPLSSGVAAASPALPRGTERAEETARADARRTEVTRWTVRSLDEGRPAGAEALERIVRTTTLGEADGAARRIDEMKRAGDARRARGAYMSAMRDADEARLHTAPGERV